jgi:hypothetical protein
MSRCWSGRTKLAAIPEAGAVNVGVAVLGGVEVDHVGDVVDVDSARGDVGGDQGVVVAALEAGEGALALALRLVAVHGDGADLVGSELPHQPVGAALGADEDQDAAALSVAELADQGVELRLVAEVDEAVLDLGLLLDLRLVDVAARVAGVGGGEIAGGSFEGGREEESLAIAGHLPDDPIDRGLEAHVEHTVGLVEDEDPDPLQGDVAALDQVLEAARGGDDDVRLAGALHLGGEADPAVDGGHSQRPGVGDWEDVVDDLLGELAGGCEDEGRLAGAVGVEPVDDRNAEGERLARPGRRLDEDVLSGEDVRDTETLNREGLGEAALGECAHDGAGHAEIGE